jgi:hypothetical protein
MTRSMKLSVLASFVVMLCASPSPARAFPLNSTNFYEVSTGQSNYNATTAYCNSGDVVVSGLCYTTNNPPILYPIIQAGESGKDSWTCVWKSNSGCSQSGTCYYETAVALCAHQ